MLMPSSGSTTTFKASTTCSTVGAPPSLVVVSSLIGFMLLPGRGRLVLDLYLEGQLYYRSQRRGDRAVFLLGELERFPSLHRVDRAARDVLHGDPTEGPRRVRVLLGLYRRLELFQVLALLVEDVNDVVGGARRQ